MKRTVTSLFMAALVAGCAAPQQGGPSPEHGFNTFGQGIGHLILSPFMIVAGLLEGVSTVPYFVSADLHEMNRAMVEANSQVNLERTYQYAYKEKIEDVPASGDTGKIFRHLSAATEHFQRVLKGYGVEDYAHYILTGIRTADREGYTLYAVLMTIAANSVLVNRRSDDYWNVEQRWLAGEFKDIVAERKRYLDKRMGVST